MRDNKVGEILAGEENEECIFSRCIPSSIRSEYVFRHMIHFNIKGIIKKKQRTKDTTDVIHISECVKYIEEVEKSFLDLQVNFLQLKPYP
jgi:hypothetical protein